jgi:hypothetical protein
VQEKQAYNRELGPLILRIVLAAVLRKARDSSACYNLFQHMNFAMGWEGRERKGQLS